MNFENTQIERVNKLITNTDVFNRDIGNGLFRKNTYSYILKDYKNNLFCQSRDEIIDYFKKNNITWWGGKNPTNHTLSSQIACLNHLFPIRKDKSAVLSIAKRINPDIIDVLSISTDKYLPAFIQFEAISEIDHLNEEKLTRGSNCTSIDALIYAVDKGGRKLLIPIEWKYVETYGNKNMANEKKSGETRKIRYTDLIKQSKQLILIRYDIYYYEPFYQLMRQTLWVEQMIDNNMDETIKAEYYIHVQVIPNDNEQLLDKIYKCSGKKMEDTWRECIKDQSKYIIISPEELLKPIYDYSHCLVYYLKKRYW